MGEPAKVNGRWRIVVRTARGRGAGRLSRTFDTRGEAKRWATEITAQVQRGAWTDVDGGDLTLTEWSEHWLGRLRLAPGTIEGYRYALNRVLPDLGRLRLDALRRPIIERALNRLSYAPSTCAQTHTALAMCLHAAVLDERLSATPMAGVRAPTVPRREIRVLDRDQLAALLSCCDPRWRPMLLTAAGTGMRQGELLGLRRNRVDFLRRTISVEEQVTTAIGRPPTLTSKLKTAASRRRLPVPDELLEALAGLLESRPDADVLFVTPNAGTLWARQHFNTSVWKPSLRAAGLDESLGMHVLRHSYASHLIDAGLHPRAIMARLGHASIVETMNTYGHLMPDADAGTRAAMASLFKAGDPPGTDQRGVHPP